MSYAAALILFICFIFALIAKTFVAAGEDQPMSAEQLDRAQLHSFYREIALLVLGMFLGASIFCLFTGFAIANHFNP